MKFLIFSILSLCLTVTSAAATLTRISGTPAQKLSGTLLNLGLKPLKAKKGNALIVRAGDVRCQKSLNYSLEPHDVRYGLAEYVCHLDVLTIQGPTAELLYSGLEGTVEMGTDRGTVIAKGKDVRCRVDLNMRVEKERFSCSYVSDFVL